MMRNLLMFFTLTTTVLSFIMTATTAEQQPCTICTDGSPPQGQFGGIDCADFEADLAWTDANSAVCLQFQLEAYQYCNCPSYPETDFCPLCANGYYDIPNPRRPILGWMMNMNNGGSNEKSSSSSNRRWLTCDDVLFGNVAVNGECERNSLAAFYCGCPDAVAPVTSCSLCPNDDNNNENSDPATTTVDLLTELNRRVPPMFDATCDDFRQAAAMFEEGDAYCQEISADLPIQLTAYCGCKGVERSPSTEATTATACTLCPANAELLSEQTTLLPADNKTVVSCAEWYDVAASVTDDSYCSETIIATIRPLCCDGVSAATTTDGEEEAGTTDTTPLEEDGDKEPQDKDAAASVVCSLMAGLVSVVMMMMWM